MNLYLCCSALFVHWIDIAVFVLYSYIELISLLVYFTHTLNLYRASCTLFIHWFDIVFAVLYQYMDSIPLPVHGLDIFTHIFTRYLYTYIDSTILFIRQWEIRNDQMLVILFYHVFWIFNTALVTRRNSCLPHLGRIVDSSEICWLLFSITWPCSMSFALTTFFELLMP